MTEFQQNKCSQKLLAVIPARGGSKRVPQKNIRLFMGQPLIFYTIQAVRNTNLFMSVIVSTDNTEIADIAMKAGAEVPFIRNKNLADDFTPVSLVTLNILERLDPKGEIYSDVAQLMPNCPLRTAGDILESHKQFRKTKADSQISVTTYGWMNPWWAMIRDVKNQLSPVFPEEMNKRSQDQKKLFCPTGAIWWAKSKVLKHEKTFHVNKRTGWQIPWHRAIDIDTEEDWKIAECLYQYQRHD